jgi:lysine-specific demethylase/histidyl-hydroxylase NO66
VWARFASGCAVRLLSPQQYHDPTWQVLASLEHAFGCRVGAEVVLAPAGFSSAAAYSGPSKDAEGEKDRKEGAAMYDNADAILLQLEGRSRWRVGKSPHGETVLPAEAGYVALKDMGGWEGAGTLDVVLEPGDSLYVPKGWVHPQDTYGEGGGAHSLHLRVYANQGLGSTTAGLLELVVPQALADAIQTEAQLRGALPRRWGSLLGVAVSEAEAGEMPQRTLLLSRVGKLLQAVAQRAVEILDPAADQLAKQFVSERLPVPLSAEEEGRSAAGAPDAVIYPYTQLRMVRPGVAVMVVESGKVVLYHCMDNSRELFGSALSPMEFELDDGPAVEALLRAYPTGVVVSELDHPSEEMDDKLGVALALYKEGFLLIDDEASNPSGVPIRRTADLPTGTKSGAKKKRVKKGTGAIGIPVVDDDDIF